MTERSNILPFRPRIDPTEVANLTQRAVDLKVNIDIHYEHIKNNERELESINRRLGRLGFEAGVLSIVSKEDE